ncbi:hypothetical protein [Kribbella italica]|uniref:Uncharacterized protein n=1 Tax=Kribbella italica TaxID=1540520 RepID=A0A7W9JAT8_9ACTN|nr:hypothetical protein [Kribbella italica]MBB5838733.1 hypothetical protein [Kribbella italica]
MTAPSRRLPRSVLWALGLFAGTTAAVILSASSASAAPEPTEDHLLPATIGAVTDTVAPIRKQVVRPVVKPVTDEVLRPTVKPVTDKVLRPTLKPVVDQVVRPALKPVVDQVLRPALKPVVDQVLRPTLKPVVDHVLRPTLKPVVDTALRPALKPATERVERPATDRLVPPPVSKQSFKSSPAKGELTTQHLSTKATAPAPSDSVTRPTLTKSSLPDEIQFASGGSAPAYASIPQPADPSPAPHWPSPAAPSAPAQVLSGGSGSTIAKKYAVLGGIAPQQFAVTATVTADDDLTGPAPGGRPGTTPD